MKTDFKKNVYWFIAIVIIIAFCAIMARYIETGFGKVHIQIVKFPDSSGVSLVGKLYRPVGASTTNKMPAVLNIHGYQNDKNVDESYSIELSRRGFVVLSMDVIGHGDSRGGLSVAGLLGDPNYTCSMQSAYLFMKNLPFVDAAQLGVMGHSMGAIISERIGTLNPDCRAANIQCGFPGNPKIKNVLLTQARYDEFAFFREGKLTVDDLPNNANRMASFGLTSPVQWDTTYGSFAAGTARRATLINMEHHLQPLMNKAVAESVDWMRLSLKNGAKDAYWIEPTSQIFMVKEWFGLITLLATLLALIPLTNILLDSNYFAPVSQPMPNRYAPTKSKWWLYAVINTAIAGITYPILTQYGALSDKVEAFLPWYKMQVGNGIVLWLGVNALICAVLFFFWYRGAHKKQNVTMYDMGVSFDKEKTVFNWAIIGKTVLLGGILFAFMYVLEGFFQWAIGQEFRFVWPYMRQFPNIQHVGMFFLYFIPALVFFLVNGGLFLFGQARQKESANPSSDLWIWWVKILFAFLFGLLVVWMIQYLPWYLFNAGPGFELLGLPQFSAMWPLMLQVYIPEFAILLLLHTWFYRRTGRIYLGALMVSALMMWFLTAGTIVAV
jgi:hypothetical protein